MPVAESLFARQGYGGELHEPGVGWQLLGNGHRAYSVVLLRFYRPDSLSPFGNGGLNAYAYCGGEPINRMDPSGRAFHWITMGVAVVGLGTVAGAGAFYAAGNEAVAEAVASVGMGIGVAALGLLPAVFGSVSRRRLEYRAPIGRPPAAPMPAAIAPTPRLPMPRSRQLRRPRVNLTADRFSRPAAPSAASRSPRLLRDRSAPAARGRPYPRMRPPEEPAPDYMKRVRFNEIVRELEYDPGSYSGSDSASDAGSDIR